MEKRRKSRREMLKLNNRGSALILAMTVLSFIAVLGALAMGTALLNVNTRGLNRQSDKNFYLLETALDEIYAGVGRMSGEILKEQYADVVGKLYREGYASNEEANVKLKEGFMKTLAEPEHLNFSVNPKTALYNADTDCEKVAKKLRAFAVTFPQEGTNPEEMNPAEPSGTEELSEPTDPAGKVKNVELSVTVGSIELLKETAGDPDVGNGITGAGMREIISGVVFHDLCLLSVNTETQIESALTVDLRIDTPPVRFINEGSALLDYIMVANGGITATTAESFNNHSEWSGNIYGKSMLLENQIVTVNTSLMTAAEELTIRGNSRLTVNREGSQGSVWTDNIILDGGSKLESDAANFYVHDDMTLKGAVGEAENEVRIKGGYYGYGNEGNAPAGGEGKAQSYSSAIIVNGKNGCSIDLTELDSLMLAGRAYLDFGTVRDAYPLGESLAVRPTQTMYLIPEKRMKIKFDKESAEQLGVVADEQVFGSNPYILPETDDGREYRFTVNISPDAESKITEDSKEASYEISISGRGNNTKMQISLKDPVTDPSDPDKGVIDPAIFVYSNKKLYVYYNFKNPTASSEYFEEYLENYEASFENLLKKNAGNYGIEIKDRGSDTDIATSGSLYQVSGSSFVLFDEARKPRVSSTLSWVEFSKALAENFENLKKYLSEKKILSGTRLSETGDGVMLPAGNFINLQKIKEDADSGSLDSGVLQIERDGCEIYLSNGPVTVKKTASGVEVSAGVAGTTAAELMDSGLIVSVGDVQIKGDVTFNGLIVAGGDIRMDSSNTTLTADAAAYEPLLADEEVSPYFYDYSDVASTVLNDYEDFVLLDNWRRAGRESGGGE